MENQNSTPLVPVVDIQFRPGQKVYFFDPAGLNLQQGDHVIIDTARGPEFGICASGIHEVSEQDVIAPLRSVLRLATSQDEKIVEENRAKERKAHEVCLKKIDELGLDMQLVSVECAFDGSKLLFFFTADERVDFRELVKSLAFVFHTRIELRQIGVRDKAKMVGGLGICGRPFCCASFLEDFQPVSIKMAKTQNLSLNPTKISGTCGRLMCCLKYEQDAYVDLVKRAPKAESFVETPDGAGTVTNVNLLREEGSSLGAAIQAVFNREEQPAQPAADQPQEVRPRRRRGDKSKKPTQVAEKASAPKQEKAEKVEKAPEQTLTIRPKKPNQPKTQAPKAPAAEASAEGALKKPNFHRRRPRGGGGAKPQGGEK